MLPLETSCYFALAKLKVNAYVVSLSTLFLSDYQILCKYFKRCYPKASHSMFCHFNCSKITTVYI